jgi:hypothetical protein
MKLVLLSLLSACGFAAMELQMPIEQFEALIKGVDQEALWNLTGLRERLISDKFAVPGST